jgi:hypothetical protein
VTFVVSNFSRVTGLERLGQHGEAEPLDIFLVEVAPRLRAA